VKGFAPGESVVGQGGLDVTVRNSNAHSWVEVYYPGAGWVPFDPTPPQAGASLAAGGQTATSEGEQITGGTTDVIFAKLAAQLTKAADVLRNKCTAFFAWLNSVGAQLAKSTAFGWIAGPHGRLALASAGAWLVQRVLLYRLLRPSRSPRLLGSALSNLRGRPPFAPSATGYPQRVLLYLLLRIRSSGSSRSDYALARVWRRIHRRFGCPAKAQTIREYTGSLRLADTKAQVALCELVQLTEQFQYSRESIVRLSPARITRLGRIILQAGRQSEAQQAVKNAEENLPL
jgi:hypothetical protein